TSAERSNRTDTACRVSPREANGRCTRRAVSPSSRTGRVIHRRASGSCARGRTIRIPPSASKPAGDHTLEARSAGRTTVRCPLVAPTASKAAAGAVGPWARTVGTTRPARGCTANLLPLRAATSQPPPDAVGRAGGPDRPERGHDPRRLLRYLFPLALLDGHVPTPSPRTIPVPRG